MTRQRLRKGLADTVESHEETHTRPMVEADVPAVSRIVSEGYAHLAQQDGFSQQQLERLLAGCCTEAAVRTWLAKWLCFVANVEARVVGALAVEKNDVAEIWVHPDLRGRGVGTSLFRKAEDVIAASGHNKLTVRCASKSAKRFYESMGAKAVDVRPCPCGPLKGWPITHYRESLHGDR